MSTFRFRYHECDGTVSDLSSNMDISDLSAARRLALAQAREIMAGEIRRGRLCLSCWIVISDEHGNNVATLHFGDAVDMIAPEHCVNDSQPH